MSSAAFDKLIFSPPPILPAGAAALPPSSSSGRDFDDELKRAGQPSNDVQPDSNDATSDDSQSWSQPDLSSDYRTDWTSNYSTNRSDVSSDRTVEPAYRSPTDRSSGIDSTNRRSSTDNGSSSTTQSRGYQPKDRDNHTRGSDNSQDKTTTGAATSSAAAQTSTAKPTTNDKPPGPAKESNGEQSGDEKAPQGAQAGTPADEATAAKLLITASGSDQAAGKAQTTSDGNAANVNAAATPTEAVAVEPKAAADGVAVTQAVAAAANDAGKKNEKIQPSGQPELAVASQNTEANGSGGDSTVDATATVQTLVSAAGEQITAQAQAGAHTQASGVVEGITQKSKRQNQLTDNSSEQNQLTQVTTINLAAVADSAVGVTVASTDTTSPEKLNTTLDRTAEQAAQSVANAITSASLSGNAQSANANASAANAGARLAANNTDSKFTVVGQRPTATQVDQARFVQRVANAFKAADEQGGQIRLRLSPPELGSLKVEVSIRNGTLSARLETENNTTRSLLLDSLPALRERLAGQNIKIDRFDVDLKQDGTGNGSSNMPRDFADSRQNLPQSQNGVRITTNRSEPNATSLGVSSINTLGNGQINIVV